MTKAFDNIPQEKFDAMDESMKKSIKKDVKNLKINYIDIQNFKNIDWISTELWDINIIWGYNWNGKSSVVEAILTAIQGNKFYGKWAVSEASLVKSWENKAVINMSLKWEDQEIIIERIFKTKWKWSLRAEINWEKISQDSLDQLLNTLTLDPLKLWTLTKTKQIQEIKSTIWLNTDEIDLQIEKQEEARKEVRFMKDQSIAIYEKITETGIPEKTEEVKIEDLFDAKNDYMNIWNLVNKKEWILNKYQSKKQEILELEKKLEEAKIQLENYKIEWQQVEKTIKETELELDKKHWSLEDVDRKIADTEATNEKADKYKQYLKAKEEKETNLHNFKTEEEKLEELRSDRTKIISESNIPEYMEISEDDGILVDWTEYKLLNTARKIEVGIDLVMISWSPLKMIRIENWWELDTKTLEKVTEKILENDFSLFLERPIIDKFDSIIISDGEIVENKEDFINNQ